MAGVTLGCSRAPTQAAHARTERSYRSGFDSAWLTAQAGRAVRSGSGGSLWYRLAAEAAAFVQPALCIEIVSHHAGVTPGDNIDRRGVARELFERCRGKTGVQRASGGLRVLGGRETAG